MDTKQLQHSPLVVLGGGPGGYPAAFMAADAGHDVTLVDDGAVPGGTCLRNGCIPSKALLHVARVITEAAEVSAAGVRFAKPAIDLERLRAWKDEVIASLGGGVGQLAAARSVRTVVARGALLDDHTLELTATDGQREPQTARDKEQRPSLPDRRGGGALTFYVYVFQFL